MVKEIIQRIVELALIAILILVLLHVSGCAQTCRGASKLVQGVGETVRGVGLDIEEAVDNFEPWFTPAGFNRGEVRVLPSERGMSDEDKYLDRLGI